MGHDCEGLKKPGANWAAAVYRGGRIYPWENGVMPLVQGITYLLCFAWAIAMPSSMSIAQPFRLSTLFYHIYYWLIGCSLTWLKE